MSCFVLPQKYPITIFLILKLIYLSIFFFWICVYYLQNFTQFPWDKCISIASKSKLVFYVLFNSQNHIVTDPRHLPLVKPTQRWQPVIRCQSCQPLGHCEPPLIQRQTDPELCILSREVILIWNDVTIENVHLVPVKKWTVKKLKIFEPRSVHRFRRFVWSQCLNLKSAKWLY